MARLIGKTCVITGAAHGIGRAIAEAFQAEGAIVIATDKDEIAGKSMSPRLAANSFIWTCVVRMTGRNWRCVCRPWTLS